MVNKILGRKNRNNTNMQSLPIIINVVSTRYNIM